MQRTIGKKLSIYLLQKYAEEMSTPFDERIGKKNLKTNMRTGNIKNQPKTYRKAIHLDL